MSDLDRAIEELSKKITDKTEAAEAECLSRAILQLASAKEKAANVKKNLS